MTDREREGGGDVAQYLQVHVAPHDLAIPLAFVESIRGTAAVRGGEGKALRIEVHGRGVPVVDLATLLGLSARSLARSESVIVVRGPSGRYGLQVDRTCEIIELADRNIHDVTGGLDLPGHLLTGVSLHPFPLAVLDGTRLLHACREATA